MRHRSKKKEAEYRLRRPLVERLLQERPLCEACAILAVYQEKSVYVLRNSQDIHEIMPRSAGGSILDEKNLLALCRPCHTFVTTHPLEAGNMGLHLPGWATDKMYEEAKELREKWASGERPEAEWQEDK